ncbi:hypothetical protein ACHQM5_009921 [Ranunculus cassubicifolius]
MADGARISNLEKQFQSQEVQYGEVKDDLKDLHTKFNGMQTQFSLVSQQLQTLLERQERSSSLPPSPPSATPFSPTPRFPSDFPGSPPIVLTPLSTQIPTRPSDRFPPGFPRQPDHSRSIPNWQGPHNISFKTPKVDFPCFDGTKVRNWAQKANRYFQINPMMEGQKVLFASLFLTGRAEIWYQTDPAAFERMTWGEFVEIARIRFNEDLHDNVVGEFNKLIQITTVQDYQDRFEELQPLMLLYNRGLSEKYFVDSWISGLKEEFRHAVQMFRPVTLSHSISLSL